ncbi:MAG TPA: hypothetical protein VIH52_02755 [Candidatus Nanoarchaeia archaeon]|nr:hypothetical protein [uncultured archaeon]
MEDQKVQPLNSALWAAALALNFFWVLNILKEAFSSTKNFLNFYPSVGPLLGLFVFSGVVFLASVLIFLITKPKSQKTAFWVYIISAIIFFFMVFPPIFEPLVGFLAGK